MRRARENNGASPHRSRAARTLGARLEPGAVTSSQLSRYRRVSCAKDRETAGSGCARRLSVSDIASTNRSGCSWWPRLVQSITVTRIYTGPDGQSHAEELQMKPNGRTSELMKSDRRAIQPDAGSGNFSDWHVGPLLAGKYVITPSGRGEIPRVAGGRKSRWVRATSA